MSFDVIFFILVQIKNTSWTRLERVGGTDKRPTKLRECLYIEDFMHGFTNIFLDEFLIVILKHRYYRDDFIRYKRSSKIRNKIRNNFQLLILL